MHSEENDHNSIAVDFASSAMTTTTAPANPNTERAENIQVSVFRHNTLTGNITHSDSKQATHTHTHHTADELFSQSRIGVLACVISLFVCVFVCSVVSACVLSIVVSVWLVRRAAGWSTCRTPRSLASTHQSARSAGGAVAVAVEEEEEEAK